MLSDKTMLTHIETTIKNSLLCLNELKEGIKNNGINSLFLDQEEEHNNIYTISSNLFHHYNSSYIFGSLEIDLYYLMKHFIFNRSCMADNNSISPLKFDEFIWNKNTIDMIKYIKEEKIYLYSIPKDENNDNFKIKKGKWLCVKVKDIKNYISQRNLNLFLQIDICNYMFDNDKQNYNIHTVSMFLYPSIINYKNKFVFNAARYLPTNYYKSYYFNPHGNWNYCNYKYKFSSKRFKKIYLDFKIDEMLFASLSQAIDVKSEFNNQYYYSGPCLQISDNFGFCYAFPLIFIYFLTFHYNKKLNKKQFGFIPTTKEVIEKQGIEYLIPMIMKYFDSKLDTVWHTPNMENEMLEKVNDLIENRKHHFYKYILRFVFWFYTNDALHPVKR